MRSVKKYLNNCFERPEYLTCALVDPDKLKIGDYRFTKKEVKKVLTIKN